MRIRWSLLSAKIKLPALSTATPSGRLRLASMAAPLSPHAAVAGEQAAPVPAIVQIVNPPVGNAIAGAGDRSAATTANNAAAGARGRGTASIANPPSWSGRLPGDDPTAD